jgi:hypothetical protein
MKKKDFSKHLEKDIKWSFTINQLQAVRMGLDWVDCGIFETIKDMIASPNLQKTIMHGSLYTWISMSMLLKCIPGSRISTKKGIQNRISNLIEAGLIGRYICAKTQKTWISAGPKFDSMSFETNGKGQLTPPPANLSSHPPELTFAPPANLSSHYSSLKHTRKEQDHFFEEKPKKDPNPTSQQGSSSKRGGLAPRAPKPVLLDPITGKPWRKQTWFC